MPLDKMAEMTHRDKFSRHFQDSLEEEDDEETPLHTHPDAIQIQPALFTDSAMSPSESKSSVVEEDPISDAIGEFGRWQLKLTFLLALFNIPCTWHIFAFTFQNMQEEFWCARPDFLQDLPVQEWRNISHPVKTNLDGTKTYDECAIWDLNYEEYLGGHLGTTNITRPCTRWEFDTSEYGESIAGRWQLVCGQAQMTNVAEMMFLVGVALGGLISGIISDRFGRKRTLMLSQLIQTSLAFALVFNPWFELYLVLRLCLGFICVSVVFSGFVLCMEIVGGKWRTISGVSYLFPLPVAYISIAGIAYLIRGWQKLQLAITVPSVLLLFLFWVLPESPRWLLAMGRRDEVKVIMEQAAKANGLTLPPGFDKYLQQDAIQKKDSEEPKAGVTDLFRTPALRKISIVLYVIWFSMYLVYYGLVLNLANIGGDVYLNTVISGVVEFPAIAISILFLLKSGRRWPMCITMCGAGVACLLTLTVPRGPENSHLEWLTITLAMIGKFSVSSSNAIIPVFTAELFPTVIRNLGVGASNMSAGIALILVPYLWNLEIMNDRLPMAVLGVFGIVGGLATLLLTETADRPLIDAVHEAVSPPQKPRSSLPADTETHIRRSSRSVRASVVD